MVLAELGFFRAAQAATQLGPCIKPGVQYLFIARLKTGEVAIDQGGCPEGGEGVGFDFHDVSDVDLYGGANDRG